MVNIVSWVQANPILFTALWTVLTAAVSVAVRALDAFPRAHAVLSLLAGLGLDVPKVLDALKRILTGGPPQGGEGGGKATLGNAVKVAPLGCLAFACALLVLPGCGLLKSSAVPTDLENDFACVVGEINRGITSVDQIEQACLPGQAQTVIDIIDALLGSAEFARKHADQVPALHRDVVRAKVELAKGPPQ